MSRLIKIQTDSISNYEYSIIDMDNTEDNNIKLCTGYIIKTSY